MHKPIVYYNKIYTETLTMCRELRTILGTVSCYTPFASANEVAMFPLIIEFIADVESTRKRMAGLSTYKIGMEFERLQLYPFTSYNKRSNSGIIPDYISPVENLNGKEDI